MLRYLFTAAKTTSLVYRILFSTVMIANIIRNERARRKRQNMYKALPPPEVNIDDTKCEICGSIHCEHPLTEKRLRALRLADRHGAQSGRYPTPRM